MTDKGARTLRHCEARSAVAIHVAAQSPMDCFVPRNDGVLQTLLKRRIESPSCAHD
jgi:hypothetical protein